MGFAGVRAAVEQRFQSTWGSTSAVAYDNAPFDVPKQYRDRSPWVRLTILSGAGRRADLGQTVRHHRSVGVVVVQVFVVEDSGAETALSLADIAAAVFRDAQFSGMTFRTPQLERVGARDGWHQVNVVCPYQWDEQLGG